MKERWPEMLEYQQKVQAMTDLERAYALVHSDPERIEAALAAARREGAEEMRERAAQLAEVHWGAGASFIAEDIRALPLTPEKPA